MEAISKYEVVIVGAGAAGLSAAKQFEDEGISSILILEACSKIGGRVTTVTTDEGFVDLGAQWIHGCLDNQLFQFACPRGLIAQQSSVDGEGDFMMENGDQIDGRIVEEVVKVMDEIREEGCLVRNKKIDYFPPSAGSMFKARFIEYLQQCPSDDDRVKSIMLALYHWVTRWERVDNASDSLHQLSAQLWGDFKICEGEYNLNPKFGMDSLIQALRQDINADVKLDSPVTKIQFSKDLYNGEKYVGTNGRLPVSISCSDGSQYECQHVVVTPSLGYLKVHAKNLFSPPLPQRTLRAIDNIGFGVIGKIFLVYDEPWWKEDFVGVHLVWTENGPDFERESPDTRLLNGNSLKMEDYWYRAIAGFDPAFGHKSAICGWLAGPEAAYMETLPEETVKNVCSSILRQFLNDPSIPNPTSVHKSKWYTNPYFLGSYSNRSCATRSEDVETLSEPLCVSSQIPLMVIAGEANSRRFFSTVHGAIESGRNQAKHYINFKTRTGISNNKLESKL